MADMILEWGCGGEGEDFRSFSPFRLQSQLRYEELKAMNFNASFGFDKIHSNYLFNFFSFIELSSAEQSSDTSRKVWLDPRQMLKPQKA